MNQSRDIEIIKQIDAYLKGQLSEQKVDELWVELLREPDYLEYLETELTLKWILEKKRQDQSKSGHRSTRQTIFQRPWPWVAAAAAVIIIVIAFNWVRPVTSSVLKPGPIGKINITENLASPMVTRSQESELSEADSLLNVGFEAALSGDMNRAIQVYEQVAQQFENSPFAAQAYLNMGIIEYNNGDYQAASRSFEQILDIDSDDPILREKAYWFLGNAYLNLDQPEEALSAIQKAYDMQGIFKRPAYRLLLKLDYQLGNIDKNELEQQLNAN